jgi:hypothetical protein
MNAKARRKIEMGAAALEFSRKHPDPAPGYAAALARLEDRLDRATQLEAQQREGILLSRAATSRKKELRRSLKAAVLGHLTSVARVASEEVPELAQKFALPQISQSYRAFRTAARAIEAEAQSRKELLVKHGMSETVLQGLTDSLNEFDVMVEQGSASRVAHVGASFELDDVADEVVQIVKVMNGLNRFRFAKDGELLASWQAASSVFATPHPVDEKAGTPVNPPASGEARPAA